MSHTNNEGNLNRREPEIESDRHLTFYELDTNKSRIVFLRYQRDGCPDDAVRIAAASHVHFWKVILGIYHFFFQFLVHILSCQHGEELSQNQDPVNTRSDFSSRLVTRGEKKGTEREEGRKKERWDRCYQILFNRR